MEITEKRLKEIIREEIKNLQEAKRWKVYIDGEREPFIIGGKNEKDVKQLAHQMTYPSRIKIKKIVREGKLDEIGSVPDIDVGTNYWTVPEREKVKNQGVYLQKFSSKEARNIIDGQLKQMAQDLRKVQARVIKTWMKGAKAGAIDFFDISRGLKTGDASRAHPYETDFLVSVLTRDKIINRFRSYFKGKKGKDRN